jgi:carbonic anhydrase
VQRAWYKTGYPKLHGWVFDVRTGKLIDLELKLAEAIASIRRIYDLKPLG